MQVLIVIHGYPPTYYAGAERAGERIARWLVEHHHHVEVFAVEQVDSPEVKLETSHENGQIVHRLFYDIKSGDNPFSNTYQHPDVARLFREFLQNHTFDIIHLVSGYLLGGQIIDIAHEFNTPVAVTLTEYWFMCARLNLLTVDNTLCTGPETDMKCARCMAEGYRRFRIPNIVVPAAMDIFWKIAAQTSFGTEQESSITQRRTELQRTLSAADVVICPSRFIRDQFARYNFDVSRCQIVTHGIDGPSARKTEPLGEVLRLGYIGQISPHKGVDLAVSSVMELTNQGHHIHLDIWGPLKANDDYVEQLQQATTSYPNIIWHGAYTHGQLWDVLASFEALVVPSRWYENSPTVILEAYKMGLPVIATNLGGMAELVPNEVSGLRFELNDMNDLSRQVLRLIHEPGLYQRLQQGIPHVRDSNEEVTEIFSHYTRLLAEQQTGD